MQVENPVLIPTLAFTSFMLTHGKNFKSCLSILPTVKQTNVGMKAICQPEKLMEAYILCRMFQWHRLFFQAIGTVSSWFWKLLQPL